MIEKYYTPTIEEFHVGFICEMNTTPNKWVETSITLSHFSHLDEWLQEGHIRVKYIDENLIEDLGFKFLESIPITDTSSYMGEKVETRTSSKIYIINKEISIIHIKYDGLVLARYRGTNLFSMKAFNKYSSDTIFSGEIKNNSEFIKLLKQLGIK